MKKKAITASLLLLAIILIAAVWQSLKPEEKVDYSLQIKPILNKHCITCHGGVKKSAGLSFLFEEEAFANTESGHPAIIPGNAEKSSFIQRLKEKDPELRMPYEKAKLSDEEIDLLTRWVDQGAQWGKHWAYSLPEKVKVPNTTEEAGFSSSSESSFIKNDIDKFILEKLEANNLQPNKQAEKEVLIRRLALDITGLPPSENLFNTWMQGAISYEAMVDTLLSKESYGEKWATWWLDLARYADTKGYEKDGSRSMWKYRDWVIQSLNKDMPYDQFTIEQLAGDLLPDPSIDQLIATAFHRNTMNNDEGGTDDEEFRVATVIDRVNTTFEVWQSTTIGCVQCHSHTYDPFKNEEYYKLMAFFNNSMDEDTPDEVPVLKFYTEKQQKEVDKINAWVAKYGDKKLAKEYHDFLLYSHPMYQTHRASNFKNGQLADGKYLALWNNGSCVIKDITTNEASSIYLKYWASYDGTKMTIKEDNENGELLSEFTINKSGNTIHKFPFKKTKEKVNLYFEAKNDKLPPQANTSSISLLGFIRDLPGKDAPGYEEINTAFLTMINSPTTTVPIMVENPDYMERTTQVFERGNWLMKADTVQPATPVVLNPWKKEWPKDRLGLAKWMVSKENPLTARTVVNRVWHQIYGVGIVASLEDMGSQSDAPSHPELLDWLSLRLMNEHNWSIKKLVKDIVLSGTYRQSSLSSPELNELDPHNELYARGPRIRLGAEQIRDQALAISGLLSAKMYGPGVMPPQPTGVWQTVYSGESWTTSKGEDKFRRGIYTFLKRTSPYPSFITFDAGSREVSTVRRTITNTPLQALVTLNDPVYLETAYHLAKYMDTENNTSKGITIGYHKALYSNIRPTTLQILEELYTDAFTEFSNDATATKKFLPFEKDPNANLAALTVVANAIMNLDEFLTKS
ncbi:PSD1 and planctomycete cytochrome C domain-containing protein [Cellulophaga sp. F20128]|uniref:PSD1 and planctomycete cytochrome C domain-containing protein n=1 Tax=Cellulophaga sp. F20128 TaxID=2926413 RepID=UPI001FF3847C|nr:PSD1 and planctomycete cytochrome C domain-containing protein [Cellulophaga sp. F20128]MCK0157930.1 PSD1 and planctomycete cytochrome C domain-containing protein [Cellulophaga sp. F20128]